MIARALRRYAAAVTAFETVEARAAGWSIRARRSTATPTTAAPTIVLLPGLGASGRYLLPVAAVLATSFPVWVPNLAGRKGARRRSRALDMAELADLTVAWMDEVGLGRVSLVGSSMGCQIAVEMAARHARRVESVVLQAPTTDAHARTAARQVWRLAVDGLREPPSLIPLQASDWLRTGVRRLAGTAGHAFAHPVESRLPSVRCPALVVHGARDPVVPQRWAEEVAAGLPEGILRVVPAGTHALAYAAPDVLADIITPFLTGGSA